MSRENSATMHATAAASGSVESLAARRRMSDPSFSIYEVNADLSGEGGVATEARRIALPVFAEPLPDGPLNGLRREPIAAQRVGDFGPGAKLGAEAARDAEGKAERGNGSAGALRGAVSDGPGDGVEGGDDPLVVDVVVDLDDRLIDDVGSGRRRFDASCSRATLFSPARRGRPGGGLRSSRPRRLWFAKPAHTSRGRRPAGACRPAAPFRRRVLERSCRRRCDRRRRSPFAPQTARAGIPRTPPSGTRSSRRGRGWSDREGEAHDASGSLAGVRGLPEGVAIRSSEGGEEALEPLKAMRRGDGARIPDDHSVANHAFSVHRHGHRWAVRVGAEDRVPRRREDDPRGRTARRGGCRLDRPHGRGRRRARRQGESRRERAGTGEEASRRSNEARHPGGVPRGTGSGKGGAETHARGRCQRGIDVAPRGRICGRRGDWRRVTHLVE